MDQNLTSNISCVLLRADVLNQKGGFKHIRTNQRLSNIIERPESTLKVGNLKENKRAVIRSTFFLKVIG